MLFLFLITTCFGNKIDMNQVDDATEQIVIKEEDIFDAENSTLDLATTVEVSV